MVTVDKITLNYENLPRHQEERLLYMAHKCVYEGITPDKNDPLIIVWMNACKFTDDQFSCVISTVWPARVFYSILIGYRLELQNEGLLREGKYNDYV